MNEIIGYCGDLVQLGKGKRIPSSEPMGSEEIKYAKGDQPPVRCNSTKAGFCITKTGAPMDNIVTDLPEGVKILAPEFERSFISARVKEEVNPEQLVVGNSTDVEQPLGQGQGIEHVDEKKISSLGSELAVREENDRFLKESASKSASLICNQAKLHSFPEEGSTKKFSHNLNMNSKECRKYIVIEDDMKEFQKFMSGRDYLRVMPKSESRTNSDDMDAVTSRPSKKSCSNSLPDLKKPILIKNNKGAFLEACLDNFGAPSAEEDDKGTKVKQENESHESVEGSDNVRSVSTGKRKCSFTDGMRSCKIQKLNAGTTPCSETFLKKGSSFMKWISNLMKGLSEFNLDRKFLSENSQRPLNDDNINLDSLCMLEETDQDADMCRNRSFRNFFHAMYCKDLSLHGENFENSECVMGAKESWKVGESSTRPSGEGCSYAASGKNNELQYQPKTSKLDERYGSCIGGNSPSLLTLPSLGNTIAVSKEKYKDNTGGNSCSYNIACGFEKTGINLPRTSSVKGSGSSTNVMGHPMPDGIEGVKPSEITSNKKVTDRNLWIARLSPSCSARSLKPLSDSKGVDCANEALALVGGGVSSFQNSVDATMKSKMLEASQPASRRSMDGCVSPMDMHYSKRNENFELEKLPTKLPSQRFILPFPRSANVLDSPANDEEIPNNPYMFSSRNVKGLNIHKQTITASTARETNTLLCFFCGSVGHSIRKCSEIAKCKLEYPLTNIIACDSDEECSHFCIRCFQLDHWAISCPWLSSPVDRMGLERMSFEKAGAPLDHDRKHSTQPKAIDNDYGFNKQKARVVDNDQAAVDNPRLERSQSAPSSGCLESKPNQIIPFFGPHTGNTSLPHAMFERIRRLQLSRSDIVRWMKVPQLNPNSKAFSCECASESGKNDLVEVICVACISGVIQERELGRNKIQLLVNLGSSNCLVDYGYVSNHEFTEEELMEWWFSTLSGDAYVPSEEDFRLKIEEKKKLNISCPE